VRGQLAEEPTLLLGQPFGRPHVHAYVKVTGAILPEARKTLALEAEHGT
jgi:hypothetical protein